jgi:hypothetical protein
MSLGRIEAKRALETTGQTIRHAIAHGYIAHWVVMGLGLRIWTSLNLLKGMGDSN